MSNLISLAVRYSRDRTSAFFGLFGGSGLDALLAPRFAAVPPGPLLPVALVAALLAAALFSSAVFLVGAFRFELETETGFLADLAFLEVTLGMYAENDHWG